MGPIANNQYIMSIKVNTSVCDIQNILHYYSCTRRGSSLVRRSANQTCSVGTDHGYGYGYGYEAMGMGTGTGSRPWVWVRVRVRDHGYGYGYGYDM